MPLVYMIGIDWSEAFTAGRVMGIKLIPNEMLAYMELGTLRMENEMSVCIARLLKTQGPFTRNVLARFSHRLKWVKCHPMGVFYTH